MNSALDLFVVRSTEFPDYFIAIDIHDVKGQIFFLRKSIDNAHRFFAGELQVFLKSTTFTNLSTMKITPRIKPQKLSVLPQQLNKYSALSYPLRNY